MLGQNMSGDCVAIMHDTVSLNRGLCGDRRSPDNASGFRFEMIGDTGMDIQGKGRRDLPGVIGAAVNAGIEMHEAQGKVAWGDTELFEARCGVKVLIIQRQEAHRAWKGKERMGS